MGRKKTTKIAKDEWNLFCLLVTEYNVALDWGFNSTIHDRKWRSDDSPVYESNRYLYLDCVVIWPEEQEGDIYHITLSEPLKDWFLGPPTDFSVRLGAFAVKDKNGNPKYRKYKDQKIPIYNPPFEIGSINKNSDEYHAWASVDSEILSQMINLVLSRHKTYVHIYEIIKPKPVGIRRGRNRWITRVSVHLGDEDERQIEIQATPEKQP